MCSNRTLWVVLDTDLNWMKNFSSHFLRLKTFSFTIFLEKASLVRYTNIVILLEYSVKRFLMMWYYSQYASKLNIKFAHLFVYVWTVTSNFLIIWKVAVQISLQLWERRFFSVCFLDFLYLWCTLSWLPLPYFPPCISNDYLCGFLQFSSFSSISTLCCVLVLKWVKDAACHPRIHSRVRTQEEILDNRTFHHVGVA